MKIREQMEGKADGLFRRQADSAGGLNLARRKNQENQEGDRQGKRPPRASAGLSSCKEC